MTHIDNIPHILKYGITHRTSINANKNYVPIGSSEIIEKRSQRTLTTVDSESFVPGELIPFYFYVRMPMLYNIQHGYGVSKVEPTNIIYLIVSLNPLVNFENKKYYFSDGHAISALTKFYGKKHIINIDNILDKKSIICNEWGDDYILKIRKQAEFLIEGDIPTEYIHSIVCYNESSKEKLLKMNVSCPIIVSSKAYY